MFSQKTAKRVFSLLLAVLMLCSLCPLLSSCSERVGVAKCSKKKLEIDLSAYKIVYEDALANKKSVSKEITAFSGRIAELTGTSVAAIPEAAVQAGGKEILIGNTSRTESKKATESIKGDGFAILVSEDKIVITGSSYLHTLQALAFFSNQYLGQGVSGKSISVHKEVRANKLERVLLADSERCYVTFVHPKDAEMDAKTGSTYSYGGRDCEGTVLENLALQLQNVTNLSKSERNYPRIKDSEQTEGAEFLIGTVDRELSRENLGMLQGDEYGIFVRNGSFALSAYSDIALWRAYSMLENIIKDSGSTVYLPEGFALIHPHDDWSVNDFTKPAGEGIALQSTMYAGDHSMQYYYTGSGVCKESYQSYCDTLKGEGYTVVSENSIEQSLFVTLSHKEKGHSLYVAYNDFAHRGEYEKTKDSALYNACIRVVVSPLDSVTLPDAGLLTPNPTYKKKTQSAITSGEVLSTAAGMMYIVTLEDGRFILFDGGGMNANPTEHDRIFQILSARQEQNSGEPVSTSNPVHIAAWVITHSHWDHYEAFRNVMRKYGNTGKLKMDYLIGNYPAVTSAWRIANGDINLMASDSAIKEAQTATKGGFQFIKVHTGQKLYLANVEIEVLATFEDLHPLRITSQNDTNTVLRFTMHSTDGNGKTVGTPTTMLWLGDSYFYQSRYLCAMYGSYLKSDMVQIAHHGNVGCEKELYATVQASVLWFPIFVKHFDLFLTPKWTASYEVNHYTVNLPSTKYIYVSGNYDITLPFSATTGMPDYNAIYDTISGTPIAYDNIAAFNSTERFQ